MVDNKNSKVIDINGVEVYYNESNLVIDKYWCKTGIGTTKYNEEVWICYYDYDDTWEIERYMNDIMDWKYYAFCLENKLRENPVIHKRGE